MLNNTDENIEQCGQHNAVSINPEQVVRFLLCIKLAGFTVQFTKV